MPDKKRSDSLIVCKAVAFSAPMSEQGYYDLEIALAGEWKGRDMTVTEQNLKQMVDNYIAEGRDILFDYDHHSLEFVLANTRAAGWGKELEVRDGKLFCKLYPTEEGKKAIENGEYRYLSPVYEIQRIDRITGKRLKDWRLHSVALTNTPYLTELPQIKNSDPMGGNMEEILKALGVTTEEEALAKVNELKNSVTTLSSQLATVRAEQAATNQRLNEADVESAIANKKLFPAQKELAIALINKDRALYDQLIASSASATQSITSEQVIAEQNAGVSDLNAVKSFRELLDNPELSARMEKDNPARFNELYDIHMKEGK